MNRGGFVSIYGLRGVGKSSIAWQLKLIAEGDKDFRTSSHLRGFCRGAGSTT